MQITSIELYGLLKGKIGDKEAKTLVTFIENEVEHKIKPVIDKSREIFKNDIASLKEYMDKVFATKADLANLRVEKDWK